MAKMTKADKVVNFLTASFGCREQATSSRKYRCFKSSSGKLYWVGKNGAVKTGRTISDSISITDMVEARMKN